MVDRQRGWPLVVRHAVGEPGRVPVAKLYYYYTNWSLGISFEYKPFTLSFTYSDTNLTKENCFVFAGDPGGAPGGAIDAVTNPMGLRSNWCGPAFVGTLSWEFSPVK
jgi:hypothetical protein